MENTTKNAVKYGLPVLGFSVVALYVWHKGKDKPDWSKIVLYGALGAVVTAIPTFYIETKKDDSPKLNAAGASRTLTDISNTSATTDRHTISNEKAGDYATQIYNAKGTFSSDQQSVLDVFNNLKNVPDVLLIASIFKELYGNDMYGYISDMMTPLLGHDYMPDLNTIISKLGG